VESFSAHLLAKHTQARDCVDRGFVAKRPLHAAHLVDEHLRAAYVQTIDYMHDPHRSCSIPFRMRLLRLSYVPVSATAKKSDQ
jgi:hypothetical protein